MLPSTWSHEPCRNIDTMTARNTFLSGNASSEPGSPGISSCPSHRRDRSLEIGSAWTTSQGMAACRARNSISSRVCLGWTAAKM